jgi:hypothetical protein
MNEYTKASEYTKSLAASMNETKKALTEALARSLYTYRSKEQNDKIHEAKHGIHEDTKTL